MIIIKHSIDVHNSLRPLDRLTLTVTLTLTFDLIFIGQGIVMDYPSAKFGDFGFSHFGYLSCAQSPQTDRITEADQRYTE